MASNSSDDAEMDESLIPSAAECQFRCDSFVTITETDQALAQYYLQRNGWVVERAVISYLDRAYNVKVTVETEVVPIRGRKPAAGGADAPNEDTALQTTLLTISWNLDGLDQVSLRQRTIAAANLLVADQPDVVFLQEVVPESHKILQGMLHNYKFFADKDNGYYNLTLVRKPIKITAYSIVPLRNTKMYRNMICVETELGGQKIVFLNVHLESTIAHMTERVAQLSDCFAKICSYPADVAVVFAGDMNLRDREIFVYQVLMAGGIPVGVDDVWLKCGARKSAEYTWDLKTNTNKQMPCRNQPRCRFDRMYIRYSATKGVQAKNFCIAGVEKMANATRFISDHWAIRAEFDLIPQATPQATPQAQKTG